MSEERPEVPLSDEIDRCALDATVHEDTHPKPDKSESASLSLERSFIGYLGESTFANWTGIPRRRPTLDKVRDAGDVSLGGSIKSAPFWKDKAGRKDQNWHFTKPTHRTDRWAVFIAVEIGRDLGPVNARQLRMAQKCLATRRWIEGGRWKEPVGSIWGWQTIEMLERLPPRKSVEDGTYRAVEEWRLVNWRYLIPWPGHPRPTTPGGIFKLLGLAADESDRHQAMSEMRRALRESESD